jgi:hypothetical protein
MASIGRKDGVFHIRFRFRGVQYNKSLKTRYGSAAEAALHIGVHPESEVTLGCGCRISPSMEAIQSSR